MANSNELMEGSVYAVVLAGGSGTRFWPISREAVPKQMIALWGRQTLLDRTLSRIRPRIRPERTYIVTTEAYASYIKRQCILGKGPEEAVNLIIEPVGKNTAPAIGLAAVILQELDSEGVMVVLPSDHHIVHADRFLKALDAAARLARMGYLVTLGIRPTRPETGYGYIKIGAGLPEEAWKGLKGHDAFYVSRFTEKPDRETAEIYILEGCYFWNSGMFVWKASAILDEIRRLMPKLYGGLERIRQALKDGDRSGIDPIYRSFEAISIDYGVMEKSDNVVLIPTDMGWSDVGSWRALEEVLPKDGQGNIVSGDGLLLETRNSLVWGGNRLLTAIGLEGMVVVDTPDALLVCPKDRSQEVRRVVEILKARGREEAIAPKAGDELWGSWRILDRGEDYRVRIMEILPKARIDPHQHKGTREQLIVVAGAAVVTFEGNPREVRAGQGIPIPMGDSHAIENRGEVPCRIIEIQTGT